MEILHRLKKKKGTMNKLRTNENYLQNVLQSAKFHIKESFIRKKTKFQPKESFVRKKD
jgi:hypothetical protein